MKIFKSIIVLLTSDLVLGDFVINFPKLPKINYDLGDYKECFTDLNIEDYEFSNHTLYCDTFRSSKCQKFFKNPKNYLKGISKKNLDKVKTDIKMKKAYLDFACLQVGEDKEFCPFIDYHIETSIYSANYVTMPKWKNSVKNNCDSVECSEAFYNFYKAYYSGIKKLDSKEVAKEYKYGMNFQKKCIKNAIALRDANEETSKSTEDEEEPKSTGSNVETESPISVQYNVTSKYSECLKNLNTVMSLKELNEFCITFNSSKCKEFYKSPKRYLINISKDNYEIALADIERKRARLKYACTTYPDYDHYDKDELDSLDENLYNYTIIEKNEEEDSYYILKQSICPLISKTISQNAGKRIGHHTLKNMSHRNCRYEECSRGENEYYVASYNYYKLINDEELMEEYLEAIEESQECIDTDYFLRTYIL